MRDRCLADADGVRKFALREAGRFSKRPPLGGRRQVGVNAQTLADLRRNLLRSLHVISIGGSVERVNTTAWSVD
jgi:hypothetical protein